MQHVLAHAVSAVLVVLARACGCRHMLVEWLVTLRGKRGRSRDLHWWVTTAVRDLLFRLLKYKAELLGIRVLMVPPGGASRVCQRCLAEGKHVVSPDNKTEKGSGSRFVCSFCGYQADRDYAASLSVGRVGLRLAGPVSYSGLAVAEPFPSQGNAACLIEAVLMNFLTTLGYVAGVKLSNMKLLVERYALRSATGSSIV